MESARQGMPSVVTVGGDPTFTIELPWPPSVNHYWRSPTNGKLAGQHMVSQEGRVYRNRVSHIIAVRRAGMVGADLELVSKIASSRLGVLIDVWPPDRRRRDLDNIGKALLDSLEAGRLMQDDGQIDLLTYRRQAVFAGGLVRVSLWPIREG